MIIELIPCGFSTCIYNASLFRKSLSDISDVPTICSTEVLRSLTLNWYPLGEFQHFMFQIVSFCTVSFVIEFNIRSRAANTTPYLLFIVSRNTCFVLAILALLVLLFAQLLIAQAAKLIMCSYKISLVYFHDKAS